MKTILAAFLSLLILPVSAQIPNAGFENWSPNQACLRPDLWNSAFSEFDSSGSYCPIQRSDDHYPEGLGQYSVRIANDTALWHSGTEPASWLGWGILFSAHLNDKPLFPVQGRPKSFCGYYRFLPENGDTLNLRAFLYKNGQEITMAHFRSSQPAGEWTAFRAYFNDTTYASVDSARITLSSANEPKDGSLGPLGNSILWVDNISFDVLLTVIEKRLLPSDFTLMQDFKSREYIIRKSNQPSGRKTEIQLLDLNGRAVAGFSDEFNGGEIRIPFPEYSRVQLVKISDGQTSVLKMLPPAQ